MPLDGQGRGGVGAVGLRWSRSECPRPQANRAALEHHAAGKIVRRLPMGSPRARLHQRPVRAARGDDREVDEVVGDGIVARVSVCSSLIARLLPVSYNEMAPAVEKGLSVVEPVLAKVMPRAGTVPEPDVHRQRPRLAELRDVVRLPGTDYGQLGPTSS